jgi:hypothetical protein
VRELTCIIEHKRCAGSSIATGMVTHVGQFLSEVPDKEGTLGIQVGGLSMSLKTVPHRNSVILKLWQKIWKGKVILR